MANIIIDRKKESDSGNTQVDGTVVHTNKAAEGLADMEAQMAALAAQEPPGASSRGPKARMIDTKSYDAAHPGFHHRYINVKDPDRVSQRLMEGYVQVPIAKKDENNPDAYGRRLGDELVLMRKPRARFEERQAEIDALTASRERAHVDEVTAVTEQVLAQMAQRGIRVPSKRVLINEGDV